MLGEWNDGVVTHSLCVSQPHVQTRVSRKSAIGESVFKNVLRDADGERRPSVSDGLADELTLRREEEGMLRIFVDIMNLGDSRWEPPLVRPLTRRRGTGMGGQVLYVRGDEVRGQKRRRGRCGH